MGLGLEAADESLWIVGLRCCEAALKKGLLMVGVDNGSSTVEVMSSNQIATLTEVHLLRSTSSIVN